MPTSPRPDHAGTIVYLSGHYLPEPEAKISPQDRGFLFADGVYEVVRFYEGRFFLLEEHLARLANSLDAIAMTPGPAEQWPDWTMIFDELLRRNGLYEQDGFVYLQVTRGVARRSHAFPPPDVSPTGYAYAWAHPRSADDARRRDGVAVISHPDQRWARCDIKSVALLPNVLAQEAARRRGCYEALLFREDATVTEGSHSSLFAVRNGEVWTHPLTERVLPGITRSYVLDLARQNGVTVREEPFTLQALRDAEELFLTGTGSEIAPVVRLDEERVGSGAPGPITRRLQDLFEEEVAAFRQFARTAKYH